MIVCGFCGSAPATEGNGRGCAPCWEAVCEAATFLGQVERLHGPGAARRAAERIKQRVDALIERAFEGRDTIA